MARPRLISDAQILDATRTAVAESGPGVSLDVVAGKLGVSQPALLKRFGSRQKLMVAALRPPAEPPYAAKLRAGPDDRPLREQLAEVIGWLFAYFEENAPLIAALRESGIPMCDVFPPSDGEPPPLRIKRGVSEWLRRARTKGLLAADCDVDTVALCIVSTVSASSHMRHLFRHLAMNKPDRAFLKSVTDFFDRALEHTTPRFHRLRAAASARTATLSRPPRNPRRTE